MAEMVLRLALQALVLFVLVAVQLVVESVAMVAAGMAVLTVAITQAKQER